MPCSRKAEIDSLTFCIKLGSIDVQATNTGNREVSRNAVCSVSSVRIESRSIILASG